VAAAAAVVAVVAAAAAAVAAGASQSNDGMTPGAARADCNDPQPFRHCGAQREVIPSFTLELQALPNFSPPAKP
jgi:hypothetical protein